LSILPYKNEHVFSVESNSTVSGLAFNSSSLELNFIVSGPDDTDGYVRLIMAKSVVTDVADVEVLLDGKKTDYYTSSLGDSWLLMFNYTHSTHYVGVTLGVQSEQQRSEFASSDFPVEYAYAAIIAVIVAAIALTGYMVKRKRSA